MKKFAEFMEKFEPSEIDKLHMKARQERQAFTVPGILNGYEGVKDYAIKYHLHRQSWWASWDLTLVKKSPQVMDAISVEALAWTEQALERGYEGGWRVAISDCVNGRN